VFCSVDSITSTFSWHNEPVGFITPGEIIFRARANQNFDHAYDHEASEGSNRAAFLRAGCAGTLLNELIVSSKGGNASVSGKAQENSADWKSNTATAEQQCWHEANGRARALLIPTTSSDYGINISTAKRARCRPSDVRCLHPSFEHRKGRLWYSTRSNRSRFR
jgi:hypothetical protein